MYRNTKVHPNLLGRRVPKEKKRPFKSGGSKIEKGLLYDPGVSPGPFTNVVIVGPAGPELEVYSNKPELRCRTPEGVSVGWGGGGRGPKDGKGPCEYKRTTGPRKKIHPTSDTWLSPLGVRRPSCVL